MNQSNIHSTAIIEPGAKIGKGVTIEPYAIIKQNVTLEDNVVIKSHAYIDGYTTIGDGTVVYPSAISVSSESSRNIDVFVAIFSCMRRSISSADFGNSSLKQTTPSLTIQ